MPWRAALAHVEFGLEMLEALQSAPRSSSSSGPAQIASDVALDRSTPEGDRQGIRGVIRRILSA